MLSECVKRFRKIIRYAGRNVFHVAGFNALVGQFHELDPKMSDR